MKGTRVRNVEGGDPRYPAPRAPARGDDHGLDAEARGERRHASAITPSKQWDRHDEAFAPSGLEQRQMVRVDLGTSSGTASSMRWDDELLTRYPAWRTASRSVRDLGRQAQNTRSHARGAREPGVRRRRCAARSPGSRQVHASAYACPASVGRRERRHDELGMALEQLQEAWPRRRSHRESLPGFSSWILLDAVDARGKYQHTTEYRVIAAAWHCAAFLFPE